LQTRITSSSRPGGAPRRGAIELPLEHRSLDAKRAGDRAGPGAVVAGADVHDRRPRALRRERLCRLVPVDPVARRSQQVVDGGPGQASPSM